MTSARSVRPVLILLAVYFLSMWAGAAAVHAQGVTPDVSLTCENPQPIRTDEVTHGVGSRSHCTVNGASLLCQGGIGPSRPRLLRRQ